MFKKTLKTIKSIDIDYILSIDTKKQKNGCLGSVKRTQFFTSRTKKSEKNKYLWLGAVN
jgi:hypothetical protein